MSADEIVGLEQGSQEWIKALDRYHGLGVDKLGNVFSKLNNRYGYGKWKLRAPRIGRGQYYVIDANFADGKRVARYVHSLVAEAFIGDRPPSAVINHKDGNKLNNYVENLEYVSQSENMAHSYREKLRGTKLTREQVAEIRRTYIPRNPLFNQYAIAKRFGVCQATVRELLAGDIWK